MRIQFPLAAGRFNVAPTSVSLEWQFIYPPYPPFPCSVLSSQPSVTCDHPIPCSSAPHGLEPSPRSWELLSAIGPHRPQFQLMSTPSNLITTRRTKQHVSVLSVPSRWRLTLIFLGWQILVKGRSPASCSSFRHFCLSEPAGNSASL